jgi:hypothetical protein
VASSREEQLAIPDELVTAAHAINRPWLLAPDLGQHREL